MHVPLCDRCGEEVTDKNQMTTLGRKFIHFHCPRDARQAAWDDIADQLSRGEL